MEPLFLEAVVRLAMVVGQVCRNFDLDYTQVEIEPMSERFVDWLTFTPGYPDEYRKDTWKDWVVLVFPHTKDKPIFVRIVTTTPRYQCYYSGADYYVSWIAASTIYEIRGRLATFLETVKKQDAELGKPHPTPQLTPAEHEKMFGKFTGVCPDCKKMISLYLEKDQYLCNQHSCPTGMAEQGLMSGHCDWCNQYVPLKIAEEPGFVIKPRLVFAGHWDPKDSTRQCEGSGKDRFAVNPDGSHDTPS